MNFLGPHTFYFPVCRSQQLGDWETEGHRHPVLGLGSVCGFVYWARALSWLGSAAVRREMEGWKDEAE